MTNNKAVFHDKFKAILTQRKITMSTAADELGVSRQHLSKVVNGKEPGGLTLLTDVQLWSKGVICYSDMILPERSRLKVKALE